MKSFYCKDIMIILTFWDSGGLRYVRETWKVRGVQNVLNWDVRNKIMLLVMSVNDSEIRFCLSLIWNSERTLMKYNTDDTLKTSVILDVGTTKLSFYPSNFTPDFSLWNSTGEARADCRSCGLALQWSLLPLLKMFVVIMHHRKGKFRQIQAALSPLHQNWGQTNLQLWTIHLVSIHISVSRQSWQILSFHCLWNALFKAKKNERTKNVGL